MFSNNCLPNGHYPTYCVPNGYQSPPLATAKAHNPAVPSVSTSLCAGLVAEGLALCRTPAKASRVTQPVALQLRQVELLVLGEMVLLVVEVDISGIRNQLMHLL